jgi:hypothetical protein
MASFDKRKDFSSSFVFISLISEYATVGLASQEQADKEGVDVDVYRAGLEHNDRGERI